MLNVIAVILMAKDADRGRVVAVVLPEKQAGQDRREHATAAADPAEYLMALEADAAAKGDAPDDEAGGGSDGKQPRRYERKPPKVISPSDPQSAWTAKANKRVQFGYGLNYLVDIENAVIVDVGLHRRRSALHLSH
jgi:hypothetical protein